MGVHQPVTLRGLGDLTKKQREVLELLADGYTSKEIALTLGLSPSAVNQRIEPLRLRLGGVTRAELARRFRACRDNGAGSAACKENTADKLQLFDSRGSTECSDQDWPGTTLDFADALEFGASTPWENGAEPAVVPKALDGKSAGLHRALVAIAIALGLAVLVLVILTIDQELSRLA